MRKILNNKILILPRNNINVDNYIKKYKSAILVKDFKMIDISSTKIRNLIKEQNILVTSDAICPFVWIFLKESTTFKVYKEMLKKTLNLKFLLVN